MKELLSCVLAGIALSSGAVAADDRSPLADSSAMVISVDARFTVLTPRLLRLEWAEGARFEDHASLVFLNRKLPVPRFTVEREDGWLQVSTDSLVLRYREGTGKFSEQNLQILFGHHRQPGAKIWHPGVKDSTNLLGTTRTLDGAKGAIALEPGLLSRTGWTVVDDSERPLLDNSDWPWVMSRPAGERQDLYFFGYGADYKGVLGDFVKIAGRIPIPPRFAFGTWWSRYWSYTDAELKDLVKEFRSHAVPLDVLVVDMDWHLTFDMRWSQKVTDQAGQRLGWTGYTWDRNFFPDPDGFMQWCEAQGLKTTLNLHPASGIQPHEEQYPAMARSMGVDPATQQYIPFDIVNRKFAENYLNNVIHPLEDRGVDFWWLDWQQWGTTTIPGVTPTWWLNYVFFTDMERRGKNRPLMFHRWGGLGNHRYQIGFSGDAISVWESLAFQPQFTATAANVGFGYWSHDIGGHMPGPVSPELYTRWIQFGIFSPILRTHTTKNPESERRIWAYPDAYFTVMRDAYKLRYALIPYIYTEARKAYDTGIAICRPMYYDHPLADEAYAATGQYMFGDAMIVAPIATPLDATQTSLKEVWLPEGEWFEWYTGAKMAGPGLFTRSYTLEEVPVFVRAGAIVPMQPDMMYTGERPVDPLILTVFPGSEGKARVYEDMGNSTAYQKGECSWTPVVMNDGGDGEMRVVVGPREGSYPGMLTQRAYEFRLVNRMPPSVVQVDDRALEHVAEGSPVGWWYDGERSTVVIRTPRANAGEEVELRVKSGKGSHYIHGVPGALRRLKKGMDLVNTQWPKEWSSSELVAAVQTGNRMSRWPERGPAEIEALHQRIDASLKQLPTLSIADSVRVRVQLLLDRSRELLSR